MKTVEYKVRAVTRYIVTHFVSEGNLGSSSVVGEFDNESAAQHVAESLRQLEVTQGDDSPRIGGSLMVEAGESIGGTHIAASTGASR